MLLKSSFLILLLIINMFVSDIRIMLATACVLIIVNIFKNKNLKACVKKLKFVFLFYASTFLIHLFYNQEGRILYKIHNFYITELGVYNFSLNFLRIFNLILISWLFNGMNVFKGRVFKSQKVVEIVIEMIPQVFVLIKKRMKIKWFWRHILKEINSKID